jgi:Fibronectin type III domain
MRTTCRTLIFLIVIEKSFICQGPPYPPGGKPSVIAGIDIATVTWNSSPYDGGKIVTGFIVEYSLVGSDIWSVAAENSHSLSYIIRNLQPGARYVFRVRAVNIHGASNPSMESEVIQMQEQGKTVFNSLVQQITN